MMKKAIMIILVGFLWIDVCQAQSWEMALNAGSHSVSGGVYYLNDMGEGYFKSGISGFYTDDDTTQYKWGALSIAAGNDTIIQGLRCEIGLDAIYGDAEEGARSGDIGAVAFTLYAGYTFPRTILPIPIEVFGDLRYAPGPLSFQDCDQFVQSSVGVGVHLIQNATLYVAYTTSDLDMKNGPGDWNLDDDVLLAGINMRF